MQTTRVLVSVVIREINREFFVGICENNSSDFSDLLDDVMEAVRGLNKWIVIKAGMICSF